MSKESITIDIGRSRPYELDITREEMPLSGLPEHLEGMTVVHLSDLHCGFAGLEAVYEEAVRVVNAAEPDLILFTGDYIDDDKRIRNYPLPGLLCRFRAKRGVFGSYGNHDHRRGIEKIDKLLRDAGIQVLNNASICIEPGLWIAGIDEIAEGHPDIPRAFADIPPEVTPIVLGHNPLVACKLRDRKSMVLSGHTHGGQIALPILTPRIYCYLHLRCVHVAGWYQEGKTRLYVNRGLGVTGQPFRYHCPAEIGIFTLRAAPH